MLNLWSDPQRPKQNEKLCKGESTVFGVFHVSDLLLEIREGQLDVQTSEQRRELAMSERTVNRTKELRDRENESLFLFFSLSLLVTSSQQRFTTPESYVSRFCFAIATTFLTDTEM